jgi:hypothetical protein
MHLLEAEKEPPIGSGAAGEIMKIKDLWDGKTCNVISKATQDAFNGDYFAFEQMMTRGEYRPNLSGRTGYVLEFNGHTQKITSQKKKQAGLIDEFVAKVRTVDARCSMLDAGFARSIIAGSELFCSIRCRCAGAGSAEEEQGGCTEASGADGQEGVQAAAAAEGACQAAADDACQAAADGACQEAAADADHTQALQQDHDLGHDHGAEVTAGSWGWQAEEALFCTCESTQEATEAVARG